MGGKITAKQLTEAGLVRCREGGLKRKLQLISQLGGYREYCQYMRMIGISGGKKSQEKLKDKQFLFREWGRLGGLKVNQKYPVKSREWKSLGGSRSTKISPKKKVVGPKLERMYNENEKKVAEWLIKNNVKYEYEPTLSVPCSGRLKYLTPDFLTNDGEIIEVSTDKREIKIKCLIEKFNNFKNAGFEKLTLITTSKNKFTKLLPSFVKVIFIEDIE